MSLASESTSYVDYLECWMAALPPLSLEKAIPEPEKTAIISDDVINKVLYERLLSRPGAAEIEEPISRLTSAFSDDLSLRR